MTAALRPTDLLGRWDLRRTVLDRRVGIDGTVTGATVLTVIDADTVRWDESGTMAFGGRSTPVSRTLLVRRRRRGGRDPLPAWTVHFADGRHFHDWSWDVPVTHACAPDDYTGLLAGSAAGWTVRWEARGPEKDLRLDSVLTRRR